MQKEEILALLDRLYLDQIKYNRFFEHLNTFTKEPRCKKGCIAFIDEIFNLPEIEGKSQLAIQLVSTKTMTNAFSTRYFIENHPITVGYNEALKKARFTILTAMAEYIRDMAKRLHESTLLDKDERQVYLRRAVARLITIFYADQTVLIETNQWASVEPYEWIDYLTTDLDYLTNKLADENVVMKWSSVYYDYNHMDNDNNIASMKTYLHYLDSFLEY